MEKRHVKIWDLPTRLFHWLLVLLTIAMFITGFLAGNQAFTDFIFRFMGGRSPLDSHALFGKAIAGLLAFRLVWGVIGSTYARFAQFVPGPARVFAYLRGQWHGLGHNPLGAFSVLGFLALMLFQVGTGLVIDSEAPFTGPLNALVCKNAWACQNIAKPSVGWHVFTAWLIVGLTSLHVLSIAFYAVVKKNNLLFPMFTGYKAINDPSLEPAHGGGWLAFIVSLLIAAGAVWVANGGLSPPPPPPPQQEAVPAW
ncbi:MAG: cytochrome b/b6 domain-containing protein [Betaproteobacteria bacterium]|nr:cytochrome b/b6 domain-containing protein [Betaproteobacteria bacterium]